MVHDEIILTDETMNGKEEISCFDFTLGTFESLQWTTNSSEKIAKCNQINNYDVCTETRSKLLETLKVHSRHSSLKSASYDCAVHGGRRGFERQCTVKLVINKPELTPPISARTTETAPTTSTTSYVTATSKTRRPTVPTTSYNTSSAALTAVLNATSQWVNATEFWGNETLFFVSISPSNSTRLLEK